MIIKIENSSNINECKELSFSKYLYCASSSLKVSNNLIQFNSIAGTSYQEGAANIGNRSFAITGNFEANTSADVESFRGDIFESLFNKPLLLFLDDDSPFYYRCVLDGNVAITYNQGWNIGRVFTLSFTLIAPIPYRYGEEHHSENIVKTIYECAFNGTVPCFAKVIIYASKEMMIRASDVPFINVGDTSIRFKKDIEIKKRSSIYIQNGIVRLNDNSILHDVLDSSSIFNPLILTKEEHKIIINRACLLPDTIDNQIIISWQDIYY